MDTIWVPFRRASILRLEMMVTMTMKKFGVVGAFSLLLVLAGRVGVLGQECTADGKLCDTHERCPVWKEEGECFKNVAYMDEHCPASCANVDKSTVANECKDYHTRCPVWAEVGECDENPANMHRYCPKACAVCGNNPAIDDPLCVDMEERCSFWASRGECIANPNYMHINCAKSCSTCDKLKKQQQQQQQQQGTGTQTEATAIYQLTEDEKEIVESTVDFGEQQTVSGNEAKLAIEIIRKTIAYMSTEIETLPDDVRDKCLNRNELCAFWAAIGECQNNEAYMLTNCAPSCQTCHMIDIDTRCPPIPDNRPALKPGDLNKMFENIIKMAPGNRTLGESERKELKEAMIPEYTVSIHSRPSTSPAIEISPILDKSLPPWVVTFDNFLTPAECQTLVDLGYQYGYERSRDVGGQNFDGSFDGVESKGRTSENAWCSTHQGCRGHEVVQRVMNRMAHVMGIPAVNSEDLQLLKYEVGQFYRVHHDYIYHQKDRQCGPRILTFFLYLSDVEDGGGTSFPQLGIEVKPKVGRALLWPSILDSRPMEQDDRTTHEALPVLAGTKFAANGWIHMYDYVGPQARGCN